VFNSQLWLVKLAYLSYLLRQKEVNTLAERRCFEMFI
jgi:hypothetical protein